MKNALVISGGGSKGAFAVGAIERLREAGITWEVVVGTSTGALLAPLVVTDEIQELRALYSRVHTDDIIRTRDLFDILVHDAIYDTTPLWQLLNDTMTPARYASVVASPVELYVTTVNLQTGHLEYWNPHHNGPLSQPAVAGSADPLRRETFLRAMLASASQPVLTPNVRIVEGGDQYVDGGVREVAPLKIAIDNGAEAIYAIVLSPPEEAPSNATYAFLVDTLLRTLDLLLQEVILNDVETAVLYNRAIRYLRAARTKATTLLPAAQVEAIFDTLAPPDPFAGKTLLDLYVIRPAEALPTNGLTFDPFVMSQMMTMGREAAEQVLQSGSVIV